MRAFVLYICIVLFSAQPLLSQTGVMRVEKPAERETDLYELIPCGELGVLLAYETQDIIDAENKKWEFTFYDTNLVEKWFVETSVLFGAELLGYELDGSQLVVFFLNTRKVKATPDNYSIIVIDLSSSEMKTIRGEMENKSEPAGFTVVGNKAFAALNVRNESAELYVVDLENGTMEKTLLNVSDQNLIESVNHNETDNSVDIAVSNYVSKRKMGMVVFKIGLQGEILESYEIQTDNSEEQKFLNTGRIYRDMNNNLVVIGTYNTIPARIPGSEDYDRDQAAGMFMVRFSGERQQFIRFSNFLELDNLRTGLTRKEYYKVQRRSMKEGAEFSLNYSLLLHDIHKVQDEYIMLVESYYPDFKTISDITYDYWGRPIPQTYTVFEGYKYIAAMIMAFNGSGELVWDNSMEIYNITTFNLEKRVDLIADSADMVMYFNEGGRVTFKAIEKDFSLTGLVHTELEPYYKGDKIMESGYDNMKRWYDNAFICYGYQRLKNNSLVERNKRTVFYFSKLQFY